MLNIEAERSSKHHLLNPYSLFEYGQHHIKVVPVRDLNARTTEDVITGRVLR